MRCEIHGIEYFALGSCPACKAAEQREFAEARRHDEALRAQQEAAERQAQLLEEAAWEQQQAREIHETRLLEEREYHRQEEQRQFLRAGLPEFSSHFQIRWQQLNADREALKQEKQQLDEAFAHAKSLRKRAAELQKKSHSSCCSQLESLLLTSASIPGEGSPLKSHPLGPNLLQAFSTAASTSYARSKMAHRTAAPSDLRSLLIEAENLRMALAKTEPLQAFGCLLIFFIVLGGFGTLLALSTVRISATDPADAAAPLVGGFFSIAAMLGVVALFKFRHWQSEFLSASARFATTFADYSQSSIDLEKQRTLTASMNAAQLFAPWRDLVSWVIALSIHNTKEKLLEGYIRATSPPEVAEAARFVHTADENEGRAKAALVDFSAKAGRLQSEYEFAFKQLYNVGRDIVTGIRPSGGLIKGLDCPRCSGLVTSEVSSCPYCGGKLAQGAASESPHG